jgi:transcriptional regulator with XRE-family HTH domain
VTTKTDMERQIKRLQDNLLSIRKIAGWTAEELGNRIGVTKQTISNIENGKVRLTQTQYIAIRSVLDYEVKMNPENVVLPQVIVLLLDSNDNEIMDDEKEEQIKTAVETIAATAAGGIAGAQLATVSGAVLGPVIALVAGPVGIIGGVVAGATLGWLAPIMKNKSKTNEKNGGKKI